MEVLKILLNCVEVIAALYFGFAALYVFTFSVASLFKIKKQRTIFTKNRRVAVLIPAYQEDSVIIEVARSALEQSYPNDLYDVVVIADSFMESTLRKLNNLPITVVEVSFEKSTKARALNRAMEHIGDDYQIALVLDADNIMEFDFLKKINSAFNKGHKVVQGHRTAKNTNTPMAVLDAISEEVNNNIFRKGHRILGLPSGLIGSGMAFDYHLFKSIMHKVDAIGGFDKELELRFLYKKQDIAYLPNAKVFDEKVQRTKDFANQRKRWLSAQLVYLKKYGVLGVKGLFAGNIAFADKVYQMMAPPRVLLLGFVFFITMAYLCLKWFYPPNWLLLPSSLWLCICMVTVLTFCIAIPRKFYTPKTARALLTLPKAFAIFFLLLFKLKGANKQFIHTRHGVVES